MTGPPPDGVIPSPTGTALDDLAIEVVEERLAVSKRRTVEGVVRISTATDVVEGIAEVELDRYRVEVTHVPVGRVVDEVPLARADGDTTIIPVVEERLVVVKQLFLKEELHIRHVVERETRREVVPLRRQRVSVERRDAAVPVAGADGPADDLPKA